MGDFQLKIKNFASDFFQYLISVGSAGVIIFYVLKYSFGVPSDIKDNNKKLSSIDEKIDTTMAMNNFIMNSVYTLEQKQEKLYEIVNETNGLIRTNTKELNNLKKVVYSKLDSNVPQNKDSQQNNLSKPVPPINDAIDSFFKKRNKQ